MISNFRKTLVLGLLLGCGTAMAGGMTTEPMQPVSNYDGFYLGGDVGGMGFTSDRHGYNTTADDTRDLGDIDVQGGGLLGYDFTLSNHFKLGLEGFIADDQIANIFTNNISGAQYQMKLRYNWGVRVLPGYEFSEGTVAHLVLAYSDAYFNESDTGFNTVLASTNFDKGGFQTGLGVTTPLAGNFFMRVDALYTMYGTHTNTGSTVTYRSYLSTMEGDFGITYKFV